MIFLSSPSVSGRAELQRNEICLFVWLFPTNHSHFPHGRIFCVTLFDEFFDKLFDEFFDELFDEFFVLLCLMNILTNCFDDFFLTNFFDGFFWRIFWLIFLTHFFDEFLWRFFFDEFFDEFLNCLFLRPLSTVLAVFSCMFVLNYIHNKEDKVAARRSRCNCMLLGSEN